MKKLLLSSVALCGLAFVSPAMADDYASEAGGVKLDIGGWFKGYGVYINQDEAPGENARNLDWLQSTEVHFGGETTLDSGLTVGAHFEVEADNSDSFEVEESYAYFSGMWGRVNVGAEDGAVYLLQVEAPSADANVDGLRQYIQPVNYDVAFGAPVSAFGTFLSDAGTLTSPGGTVFADIDGDDVLSAGDLVINGGEGLADLLVFDYDDDVSGYSNKLTYMTPIFQGFQAGVSFTPELDEDEASLSGVHSEEDAGEFGNTYELGLRYQGQWDAVGFAVGGGFTHAELEEDSFLGFTDADGDGVLDAGETTFGERDDRQSWNVGLDVDFSGFGVGVAYVEDDLGLDGDGDRDTVVVGADYTTGPWKIGTSYYNQHQDLQFLGTSQDLETDRYTGGVVYTYGPGMTFRGSISYIEHDTETLGDVEATSVLLGTQINF